MPLASRTNPVSKSQLKIKPVSLRDRIKTDNKLRNMFKEQKLKEMRQYEKNAKAQQPIIDALNEQNLKLQNIINQFNSH